MGLGRIGVLRLFGAPAPQSQSSGGEDAGGGEQRTPRNKHAGKVAYLQHDEGFACHRRWDGVGCRHGGSFWLQYSCNHPGCEASR